MNSERLVSVLEEHGFSPTYVEGGTEITIADPQCQDDKQRLYISTSNGLWMCFLCQRRGHLVSLLTQVCELNYNEAITTERSIWGGTKRKVPQVGSRTSLSKPIPSTVELPNMHLDQGDDTAGDYLEHRGLDRRWAKELGMGYCFFGYYKYRVIVPVYTEGELRTFVARTWLQNEPKKVLHPEGGDAARALFGYDRFGGIDRVILVEGVFDAIRMWELGYECCYATLGAHVTEYQRVLLKRKGFKNVVLLRDGDEAGRSSAVKEAQELSAAMMNVEVACLPSGDPCSASPEDIEQALASALQIGAGQAGETIRHNLEV